VLRGRIYARKKEPKKKKTENSRQRRNKKREKRRFHGGAGHRNEKPENLLKKINITKNTKIEGLKGQT